jgi:hypothetical protein
MNDSMIISDQGRFPVVALKREGGILLQAGKSMIHLSDSEIDRLISWLDDDDEVPPAPARMMTSYHQSPA